MAPPLSERYVDDDGGPAQQGLDSWLQLGLCLVVLGACILPLVPIWRAALTVIAVAWLVSRRGSRRYPTMVLAAAVGAWLIYGVPLLLLCLSSPARVLADSVLFPHGLPVNNVANGALLFGQLAIAVGLAVKTYRSANRYHRWFVASCVAFGAWAAFSGLWNAVTVAADQAPNILAGASTWVDWTIGATLSVAIFRDSSKPPMELGKILGLSAALIAAAVMVQWAIGDYSYVLTTFSATEFFARARASYYYHAPATQFIAFSVPVVAALALSGSKGPSYVIAIALCGLALLINGTRGISVAVVVGLALLVTFLLTTRRALNLVTPMLVAVALCLATQIVYVKPTTIPADHSATASDFTQSNAARIELGLAGTARIMERPFVGLGPGYSEVFERPDGSGRQRAPLSSHVLAVDLAVMGGIPALIAFAGMFGASVMGAAAAILRQPRSERSLVSAGFVTALATFALTSFFHPQEHSSIILVALMVAGAMPALSEKLPDAPAPAAAMPRQQRHALVGGLSALVLAFAGWLVVTSPNYVFPALEFAARYRDELRTTGVPVYTTNNATKVLLDLTLRASGVDAKVALLPDEPARLPEQSGYIVWSPADEPRYPALRAFLGPALQRSYFQWMSVALPPRWTLINNFQPTVQFIQVGPHPAAPHRPAP
jgi:hypothetical protein